MKFIAQHFSPFVTLGIRNACFRLGRELSISYGRGSAAVLFVADPRPQEVLRPYGARTSSAEGDKGGGEQRKRRV